MSDYLTNWSLSAGNEHEVRDGRNVKIVNVDCGGMTGRKYDEATKIAALVRAAPALLEALERSREGWENAIEFGLIPPQHRNAAQILADEAKRAIASAQGAS